jgi:hypothetical protein
MREVRRIDLAGEVLAQLDRQVIARGRDGDERCWAGERQLAKRGTEVVAPGKDQQERRVIPSSAARRKPQFPNAVRSNLQILGPDTKPLRAVLFRSA